MIRAPAYSCSSQIVESLIVLRHKLLYAVIPGRALAREPPIHNHRSSSCDTAHPPHFLGLWIPGSLASRQNRLASARNDAEGKLTTQYNYRTDHTGIRLSNIG